MYALRPAGKSVADLHMTSCVYFRSRHEIPAMKQATMCHCDVAVCQSR